jgi:hypothetical protein
MLYLLERRNSLWLLVAIATTFLWVTLWQGRDRIPAVSPALGPPLKTEQHPVERLIQQARLSLRDTQWRQSTTLEAAITAYRTRYDMEPPPGFDVWFEYAFEHESSLIDDYDTIYDSISPYLAIDGQRLQELVQEALQNTTRLYKCGFLNGTAVGNCGKWDMNIYMAPIAHLMPDVEFLFSDFDEPRVLLSKDPAARQDPAEFVHHGHEDNTERFYSACPLNSHSPALDAPDTHSLPFVQDISSVRDLCANPTYAHQHGFIMSPSTLLITQQNVPLLAQCAPSPFSDILYPTPYYALHNTIEEYSPQMEPAWGDKHPSLYWAGSANGGYFSPTTPSWKLSHRQRFIAHARRLYTDRALFLREPSPGSWEVYETTNANFSSMYSVHLTDVWPHLCDPATCAEQEAFFAPLSSSRGPNEQFMHRLLMDLDGNSYSGRFYSHLRSKSTSFKQTIFREWHDDRLWPWVHYVPVSMGMEELPELVRWMTETDRGEGFAREIAEEGSEWMDKTLREEDMRIYMWRLALEYKRLMDPDREGRAR